MKTNTCTSGSEVKNALLQYWDFFGKNFAQIILKEKEDNFRKQLENKKKKGIITWCTEQ